MAVITVSDLNPVGYDLFSDSESYMIALSEDELGVQGGAWWSSITTASSGVCLSVGATVLVATLVGSYLYGRYHG
jgi:hypothetical protein